MPYEMSQFRFPMGNAGRETIERVRYAVGDYVRWAPNQGGDETSRENIRSAFYILRARINRGMSIQSAAGDLERIADSMRDM